MEHRLCWDILALIEWSTEIKEIRHQENGDNKEKKISRQRLFIRH
ncbi:MAG TPA: hypothetical protein VE548_04980 [Nitrososphaeraceae archaeon]|nr:hypothetical protein [Nitrososphaeraceae archaeon]